MRVPGNPNRSRYFPRIALRRARLRCGVDPIERDAAASASSVGRLLDGHSSVGSVAAGRVLVGGPAAFARRNKMAEHLKTLVSYQLISPGSEWRLHRHWFEHPGEGRRRRRGRTERLRRRPMGAEIPGNRPVLATPLERGHPVLRLSRRSASDHLYDKPNRD